MVVRDTQAMIASMAPELRPGCFAFVGCGEDGDLAHAFRDVAIAMFAEVEGPSFVVPIETAEAHGIEALAMRQITLTVHSALDGVGLTAAVAQALAAHGIACNMVAAFHHDHVFVPESRAEDALAVLKALQQATP
ncbi:ACT domain-containing protein [Sphingomonas sp. G-3-2-10]|uniref:ACT domain-containing protein n=1 Tax=Sphingomonas sp. G-3-2-10 TaxID=2728838 RepID=UPI00146F03F6|nr:ACT domain-containing protein [Sphingomonas sp. G-3-2-10]NML04981.1 ACT domain-containing protein [Sphingomonas sp. G-3-2-10]